MSDEIQTNLRNWIPALNVLDSILDSILSRVKLYICLPDKSESDKAIDNTDPINSEEVSALLDIVKAILRFLSMLLQGSYNQEIFASLDVS